jgi:alkaline phosphatase D
MEIKTLLEFNAILDKHIARLLMGGAGIGKSSFVKMMAKKDQASLIDLRLSELEPTDLVGLPYIEGGITKFAQPYWWPTDKDRMVYLFLDEIDRCKDEMFSIAMQLTLDRRAGGRDLHDNVIIWAACNGEDYLTTPIDQPLMDRFVVIELTPSVNEWLEWSHQNNINPAVIEFIKSDPDKLDTPEKMLGKPNVVVPTRRSWARLGITINNIKKLDEEKNIGQYAATFVGYECAAAFASWLEEKYTIVSPQDIFSGILVPDKLNLVQIANCAEESAVLFLSRTREEQYNCLKFYKEAGPEAFASLFESLDPSAALIISEYPDIEEYIMSATQEIHELLTKKSL